MGGPGLDVDVRNLLERDPGRRAAIRRRKRDGKVPKRLEALPHRCIEPHLQAEASLSLDHRADLSAANGLDDREYVLRIHPKPCDGFPVDVDGHRRQPRRLLHLDLFHPRHLADDGRDLFCHLAHVLEAPARCEHLDADFRAHAADELVNAKLNRLRVAEHHPRQSLLQLLVKRFEQLLLRLEAPGIGWIQDEVGVRDFDPHGVGRNLRSAGARDDRLDFRKSLHDLLRLAADLVRSLQRHAREPPDLHRNRSLVELWNELRSKEGDDQKARSEDAECYAAGADGASHGLRKKRGVEPLHQPEEYRLLLDGLLQEQRREHGHQRQGTDERAAHGENDREGHRAEHLPLDSSEREYRQVDNHDDAHREQHGARYLVAGRADLLEVWPRVVVPVEVDVGHDALDHDHGTIDDDAEVHGPERHQVARQVHPAHEDDGNQHREWDG